MNRNVRELASIAKDLGFEYVGINGRGHAAFKHRLTGKTVTCSHSPSNRHARLQAIKQFRKAAQPPA